MSQRQNWILWFLFPAVLFSVGANLYVFHIVSNEHTLYSWDFVGYWNISSQLLKFYREHDLIKTLAFIYQNIQTQDYNELPALPIAIMMGLFNESRLVLVLSILNFYVIPTFLLLGFFTHRVLALVEGLGPYRKYSYWLAGCVLFGSPSFWLPLVRGYVDVVGLIFCFAVLTIYFTALERTTPSQRKERLLLIGALLIFAGLYRRWYLFWSEAFLVSIASIYLWRIRKSRNWAELIPLSWMAMGAFIVIYILAQGFFSRYFGSSLDLKYSAYKSKTHLGALLAILRHFGLIYVFFLAGAYYLALKQRHLRPLVFTLTAQLVIIFFHFNTVSDLGINHYYLWLASLLPVLTLGGILYLEALSHHKFKIIKGALPLLILGTYSWASYSESIPREEFNRYSYWIPQKAVGPIQRIDMPEIMRMAENLEQLLMSKPNGGQACVLSSSVTLNGSAIRNIPKSLDRFPSFKTQILVSPDIDRVNGFPECLLKADYLVVATPPQIHATPTGQRVLLAAVSAVMERKSIGQAFHALPEKYFLQGDVIVQIFERERPPAADEIESFSKILREIYPSDPFIYLPAAQRVNIAGGDQK